MGAAELLPFASQGGAVLLGLAFFIVLLRLGPKYLEQKRADRQALVTIATALGERIAAAQERQAEAITKLAELQARHDGATTESFDALQIAIASVDSRVAALGSRLQPYEREMRDIKERFETLPATLNEILAHVKKEG